MRIWENEKHWVVSCVQFIVWTNCNGIQIDVVVWNTTRTTLFGSMHSSMSNWMNRACDVCVFCRFVDRINYRSSRWKCQCVWIKIESSQTTRSRLWYLGGCQFQLMVFAKIINPLLTRCFPFRQFKGCGQLYFYGEQLQDYIRLWDWSRNRHRNVPCQP